MKFYNYVYIIFCLSDSTKLEVYSLLHSTTTAEAQSHENELPYQLKLKETLSIQDKIIDLKKPTHESERCVLTRFCPIRKMAKTSVFPWLVKFLYTSLYTSVNLKARPVVKGEHDKCWNDHGYMNRIQ